MKEIPRRSVIASLPLAAMAVMTGPAAAERLAPTPRQTEGPFYPRTVPADSDADLVQVAGRSGRASGTIAHLSGRVLDEEGRAIPQAAVEIWQCDAQGVYHHVGGSGGDPNFQGYGRVETGADGGFRFRTIRPVAYSGRTPHIHVTVSRAGFAKLTTQLYVAGEPLNARDGLYNSIRDPGARRSVTLAYEPAPEIEPGTLKTRATLVLRAAG
jgi:protocatechuate 3,4-dioxygenase beta subunit